MDRDAPYNEIVLLRKLAEGDESAFSQLFEYHSKAIYATSLHFLKDAFQAEEAVQEIFMRLWRERHTLPEVQNLNNYLFIATRNESLNRLKKILLQRRHASSSPLFTAAPVNNPQEYVAEKELKDLVQKAIRLLPPQQQQVYIYASEEGCNYEEIASRMNLSKETVKRHLSLSRKFVRAFVKRHLGSSLSLSAIGMFLSIIK